MKILAIDPGNIESGYAIIEMPDFKLIEFGKVKNEELLADIEDRFVYDTTIDAVAVEMVASYGMAVGKSVFDTCVWIGRFVQALANDGVDYVYRKDEKMCLCGSMKAKDSNIRQALIDRYAKHDFKNGKGVKKNPDTFYGVSKDVWQAIAVGVTYYENISF
jgi:Holliday junction resolvasome RuvABC endonuclease subunit